MTTEDQIAVYEALIDPTEFGTLRKYLESPNSPIQYLLHVKDPALLPRLAAELDGAMASGGTAAVYAVLLSRIQQDRTVKISTPPSKPMLLEEAHVAANGVPANAFCRVIYLPPFYLAHTPGLFEGKFNQQQPLHGRKENIPSRRRSQSSRGSRGEAFP